MQESEKKQLKTYLSQYLARKGIDSNKAFSCINPKHPDKHPSMHYDARRETVHCFACGADYDIFNLIGLDYGITNFQEQKNKIKWLFENSISPTKKKKNFQTDKSPKSPIKIDTHIIKYIEECHSKVSETDYFFKRGISETIIKKFKLGFDACFSQSDNKCPWKAAIIPTSPNSYTARNTEKQTDNKNRIRKKGKTEFLGWQELPISAIVNTTTLLNSQPLFVTEGEFDALSLWEIGQLAISLGSVANIDNFLKRLNETFQNKINAPILLLALDNDISGKQGTNKLLKELKKKGFRAYSVDICGQNKDPNEALIQDRNSFCKKVNEAILIEPQEKEKAKKNYLTNSNAAHLEKFINGISTTVETIPYQSGFPTLDKHLDGGFYEGLYVIGAISSLGKTSMLLQIADQLAKKKQDVLIFSLEMARNELIAKSISRHTLNICLNSKKPITLAKTTRDITTGKRYKNYELREKEIIKEAIKEYEIYAHHVFVHEGIGEIGVPQIREVITQHMKIKETIPVVIIDYLQILAPYNERSNEKQNIDKAVLELKRLSRDFKLPIISISSFNRANYNTKVTMEAFKESGAIEYSSDVLIGLQLEGVGKPNFDAQIAKEQNPREIELIILKNRNGPTGGKIKYKYYPSFNSFIEG